MRENLEMEKFKERENPFGKRGYGGGAIVGRKPRSEMVKS